MVSVSYNVHVYNHTNEFAWTEIGDAKAVPFYSFVKQKCNRIVHNLLQKIEIKIKINDKIQAIL